MKQRTSLKPTQARALSHIFRENSISAGLKRAQVGRRTFYSWLQSDELFRATYEAEKDKMLNVGRVELEGLFRKAVGKLEAALDDKDIASGLRASRSVLEFCLKFKETDIAQKLDRLLDELEKTSVSLTGR